MSTGLACAFCEVEKGEWYYFLQDWNCPIGAWDWMEYSTCYGPFGSQEAADEHLCSNHANPGGASIYELGEIVLSGRVAEIVKQAEK